MFLLYESITDLMFNMQLYDNFSLFLLKVGLKGCPLWKHSSTIPRNCLPRFAFCLKSNGGNRGYCSFPQSSFSLFASWLAFSLYVWLLFSNAAWCVGAALLNAVSSNEMSDR